MTVLTLLDIAKMNDSDTLVGLVDEAARIVPEITGVDPFTGNRVPNMGAGRTIKGIHYKTLVRTALPSVAFRSANQGTAPAKSTYENRLVEAFLLNPRWNIDIGVGNTSEDGPSVLMAREASAFFTAALMACGAQFYYGVSNDAKGFAGLQALVDSSMVIDAGGTTANTGSSVYAVKFGEQAVQWVYGENGQFAISDMDMRDVLDADGNPYTAYFQELFARVGLQCVNKYSVARIKNLTADSGKGLTDALISQLISGFPVGYRPDCLFASRRSIYELQKSRTATNSTGAPAPYPTEAFGIPLIATDSLVNTEAIA